MIFFKTGQLSKKSKLEITYALDSLEDVYGEFYITRNNVRLFIKDNKDLLFECLKRGDKIIYNDKGIIFVTGFSDKAKRYYIKILSEAKNVIDLFRVLLWNLKDKELWIKVNKDNKDLLGVLKTIRVFNAYYFKFFGDRGREVLLVGNEKTPVKIKKED